MTINEMRRRRAELAGQARAMLDAAQAAGRELSTEEEASFDRLMDEADQLEAKIRREERALEAQRRAAETDPPPADDDPPSDQAAEARRAWNRYLRDGLQVLGERELRALNMGNDPEGGFLVAPQQFVEQLLQNVDDAVPLRPLATTMMLTEGESLGVPTLDTDLADAEWTTEVATGSQDDSLRFGKRELRPNPLAKRVLVSRTLLRRGSLDPEQIVRERMAYKFAVTTEKAYMTGDGNKRPLGVFTASSQGISTARDVDFGGTGGTVGTIPLDATSADQLVDAKYALKPQYWRRARWLFHRDIIRQVRKLKDGQQQYLWQPGIAGGRPDTILEVPFVASEFAPSTIAADAYVGMIADFSFYWIADALNFEVQRLVELYAETNQVGFLGRLEADGMPVLEEPFVRLHMPAT